MGGLPLTMAPAQAQDPHSQYLADALASMASSHPQGNVMGLTSNLLAQALAQYGDAQRQGQQNAASPAGQANRAMINQAPPQVNFDPNAMPLQLGLG